MGKLLLKNSEVLLPNGSVGQADIVIEDNLIISVGETPSDWRDRVIDCNGKLAVPGFINTHTHAAMTLFRSYADDMLLMGLVKEKNLAGGS